MICGVTCGKCRETWRFEGADPFLSIAAHRRAKHPDEDLTLIYCRSCNKRHAARIGERPCASGAWHFDGGPPVHVDAAGLFARDEPWVDQIIDTGENPAPELLALPALAEARP